MDLNHIKKVVNSLSKLIDDNEKVALPIFAAKLANASELHPEDHTLGMMANIVARMAGSNKLFITRAEIKDLYNRLYSRNTKFAELFQDELGEVEKAPSPQIYNREHEDESLSIINKAYEKVVDPTLAHALHNAFGTNVNAYSSVQADSAKSVCEQELAPIKLSAHVDIVNGKADIVVCRASFETPRGITSVLIPVEIVAGNALLPSIFVGNNGPEDFTRDNVEQYITTNAGNKLTVNDSVVLDAVVNAKNGDVSKVSNVDLAIIKLHAQKETVSDFSQGQVLYQRVDTESTNVEVSTPTYKDDEIESFAKAFDSPLGIANYKFSAQKVKIARDIIDGRLSNLGLTNHQIAVCDCNDTTVVYAVSLNGGTVAFKVPVRIENGKIIEPTYLISNGGIESLSKAGLARLFKFESIDYKTAATASPLYGLKASELVGLVREAITEQNYAKAEDALNILATSGDDKAYQTAFVEYTNGLGGEKRADSQCNMTRTSSSSKHSICGHTGLPLHKVYQDKNGDCHPLYRKGMEDTHEGAYFMNNKIFF
jgi:hypothetical protein